MSIINAESPDLLEAFNTSAVNIIYHPLISTFSHVQHSAVTAKLLSGRIPLDVLCIEGAIINGPHNNGAFQTSQGQAKKTLIRELAEQAEVILAVGTCASFGGITAACEVEGVGMQFSKQLPGGVLGSDFQTRSGRPVINLPGCPVHPSVFIGTLAAIVNDIDIELNELNAPAEYYDTLVHQGCLRNEYHEFGIDEEDFGHNGCMFTHMGCQGPLAHGPCNKFLWNKRGSKTRRGVPCFGCTEPTFPKSTHFFETPNIVGLPLDLPEGVNRPHYLAYKGMAVAAAPSRLKLRQTKI